MATYGTVKFFDEKKGFGFIKPDSGGPEIFVHVTAVERAGRKSLTKGERVSFDIESDRRGDRTKATNLVITG
jgi:CspA family cold shock protein